MENMDLKGITPTKPLNVKVPLAGDLNTAKLTQRPTAVLLHSDVCFSDGFTFGLYCVPLNPL